MSVAAVTVIFPEWENPLHLAYPLPTLVHVQTRGPKGSYVLLVDGMERVRWNRTTREVAERCAATWATWLSGKTFSIQEVA